jgi:hypothetical protein
MIHTNFTTTSGNGNLSFILRSPIFRLPNNRLALFMVKNTAGEGARRLE